MLKVDQFVPIELVKTHTGWNLQTNDRIWHFLNEHREGFKTNNPIVQYFIDNLDRTIGLQGTTIQSLSVSKEQVAEWILNGII